MFKEHKRHKSWRVLWPIWPWFGPRGQAQAWLDFWDLSITWEWLSMAYPYRPEWDCLCLATTDVSISYRPCEIIPHPLLSHTTPYVISPHTPISTSLPSLYKQVPSLIKWVLLPWQDFWPGVFLLGLRHLSSCSVPDRLSWTEFSPLAWTCQQRVNWRGYNEDILRYQRA